MKMGKRYQINKEAKTGEECICPSCGSVFIKANYQQTFCKTKSGTKCKDKYWNTVTPTKRKNVTRISPANAMWQARTEKIKTSRNIEDSFHPQDPWCLGQWND